MANENRVAGTLTVKLDGQQLAAKGNFSYNLGKMKRESVMRADGSVVGYKESPQPPFVEGEITDQKDLDLEILLTIDNSTVSLELANGKNIVLRNAWYANEGTGETEEAKIPVRFEGMSCEEVK